MTSTTSLVLATEPTNTSVIKTDVKGRLHRTPEQREGILDEYERSGLSQLLGQLLVQEFLHGERHPKRSTL